MDHHSQQKHKIEVHIGEARNFVKPPANRKLEPYISLNLNGEGRYRVRCQPLKQGIDFKGDSADFNYDIELRCNLLSDQLHVELWNDAAVFSKDNLLAVAPVSLRDLTTARTGAPVEQRVTLLDTTAAAALSSPRGATGSGSTGDSASAAGRRESGISGSGSAAGQSAGSEAGAGGGSDSSAPCVHLTIKVLEGLTAEQLQRGYELTSAESAGP